MSHQLSGQVTIRDIAREAGVSISTVSQSLSGRRHVAPATRERVREVAATLGYKASPAARSLRTGRHGLIGLVLRPRDAVHGSIGGTETFTRLAGVVATEVLERKLALVHVPDMLDPTVQRFPMDGCIVAAPYGNDEALTELLRQGMPVVAAEEDPDRTDFPWTVAHDYAAAMTDLLDHLHQQGAKQIMLVTGTEDNAWNRRARESYETWASQHRMPAEHRELYEGAGTHGAAELIEPVLSRPNPPDAVIASASRFAAGIADVAIRMHVRVPEELMLATFTDSNFTRNHSPAITAVDLALEDMGRAAVELMLSRLAGDPAPATPVQVQPTLYRRASTARIASRSPRGG